MPIPFIDCRIVHKSFNRATGMLIKHPYEKGRTLTEWRPDTVLLPEIYAVNIWDFDNYVSDYRSYKATIFIKPDNDDMNALNRLIKLAVEIYTKVEEFIITKGNELRLTPIERTAARNTYKPELDRMLKLIKMHLSAARENAKVSDELKHDFDNCLQSLKDKYTLTAGPELFAYMNGIVSFHQENEARAAISEAATPIATAIMGGGSGASNHESTPSDSGRDRS